MGLPTISVAIMGGVLGLRETIPILVVPSLIANIWQAARPNPIGPLLRRFALMNAASCVGIWIGTMVLFRVDPRLLSALLGAIIVVIGMRAGQFLRGRIPEARFRTGVHVLLLLLAANLIRTGAA